MDKKCTGNQCKIMNNSECGGNGIQCIPSNNDEHCPGPGEIVAFHTQIQLNGLLEIPMVKPPKEEILTTVHDIKITKFTEVQVTQPLGKKVLVVGTFTVGIEYIAKVPDQKVHFAHWELPFNALIKNNDGSLFDTGFNINDYTVHACVEFEEYCQVDERTISKVIALLIWLQRKDN